MRIAPGLRRPTQWEATASVEHQFADDFAVSRQLLPPPLPRPDGGRERRRVSRDDYTPLEITNPLDGTPFTIYNQSAASIGKVDNVLRQLRRARRRSTMASRSRSTGASPRGVTLFGGVTVGSNKAATSASTNPNDRLNAAGYDLLDSRVILNLSGIYQLPWSSIVSSHLAYYSGQPLRRIYTLTRTVVPALRQASQDVAARADGHVRKPNQTLLDLRFGRRFQGAAAVTSSRCSRSTTC